MHKRKSREIPTRRIERTRKRFFLFAAGRSSILESFVVRHFTSLCIKERTRNQEALHASAVVMFRSLLKV
jgi:hypothetical protein